MPMPIRPSLLSTRETDRANRRRGAGFGLVVVALLAALASDAAFARTFATRSAPAPIVTFPATQPIQAAHDQSFRGADADQALAAALSRTQADLGAARHALAAAGFARDERNAAIQKKFSLPNAVAHYAASGRPIRDVYFELTESGYAPDASAGALVDYYADANETAPEEVAAAMLDGGATFEDAVFFLLYAGRSFQQAWAWLEDVLELARIDVLDIMLRVMRDTAVEVDENLDFFAAKIAGVFSSASAAGNWLRDVGGKGWESAAGLLVRAGYGADAIASWLRHTVGLSASRLALFARQTLGMTDDLAFDLVRGVVFGLDEAVNGVADAFELGAARVAGLVHRAGASAWRATQILVARFGESVLEDLFGTLTSAGYAAHDAQAAHQAALQMIMETIGQKTKALTSPWG